VSEHPPGRRASRGQLCAQLSDLRPCPMSHPFRVSARFREHLMVTTPGRPGLARSSGRCAAWRGGWRPRDGPGSMRSGRPSDAPSGPSEVLAGGSQNVEQRPTSIALVESDSNWPAFGLPSSHAWSKQAVQPRQPDLRQSRRSSTDWLGCLAPVLPHCHGRARVWCAAVRACPRASPGSRSPRWACTAPLQHHAVPVHHGEADDHQALPVNSSVGPVELDLPQTVRSENLEEVVGGMSSGGT
jgi:hypothetical protein